MGTYENDADRRNILKSIGLIGAAAVGSGMMLADGALAAPARAKSRGGSASAGSDVGIMQGALALEHEGIAAYRIAAGSGLLSAGTIAVASVFLGHHEGHRDALAKLIAQAGGNPVQPKTDADYIKELNIAALKSEADVVKFAAGLEQGATNAYVGQVAALRDGKLAHLFAQLGTDEAVHWALLNGAAGGSVPKAAFLFA